MISMCVRGSAVFLHYCDSRLTFSSNSLAFQTKSLFCFQLVVPLLVSNEHEHTFRTRTVTFFLSLAGPYMFCSFLLTLPTSLFICLSFWCNATKANALPLYKIVAYVCFPDESIRKMCARTHS